MKEIYLSPEMEIITFESDDMITASPITEEVPL